MFDENTFDRQEAARAGEPKREGPCAETPYRAHRAKVAEARGDLLDKASQMRGWRGWVLRQALAGEWTGGVE